MDRAEATGWGVAAAGHVALFAILSLGLAVAPKLKPPTVAPVEIEIVTDIAPAARTPEPSDAAPAPSVAPDVGPPAPEPEAAPEPQPAPEPEPAPAPPPPPPPPPAPPPRPRPAPAPRPTPVPLPRPTPTPRPLAKPAPPRPAPAKAAPKPAPAKPAPKPAARPTAAKPVAKPAPRAPVRTAAVTLARRPTGSRLGSDFRQGLTAGATAGAAPTPRAPPGPAASPAVEAGLVREVRRQLKPHWRAPSGPDVEQLRTELSIALGRDGSLASVRVLRTTGQTDSNRAQVKLHQEAAVKAVRLAAPFSLPSELYDTWKLLEPVSFDRRLGQ